MRYLSPPPLLRHTVSWITVVSSWIAFVRAVFSAKARDSLSSTSSICWSCALIFASVASRLRSERFDEAPTRKPM